MSEKGTHPIKMITGNINLTAFKSLITEMKGKNGEVKKVLVIGLDANNLEIAANGNIYFNLVAWSNKTANDKSTHGIKQQFSKEVREAMSKDESYAQPFFGNLQALVDTGYSEPNNATVSNDASFEEANDDLPF